MDKPIFNHTAHKAIWDYLADHPGANKTEAIKALGLEHFNYPNECPACGAKKALLATDIVVFRSMYEDKFIDDGSQRCMKDFLGVNASSSLGCIKCCPLEWADHDVCTSPFGSLFNEWAELQYAYEAHVEGMEDRYEHRESVLDGMRARLKEYATIIRDLPFNDTAKDYYDIV